MALWRGALLRALYDGSDKLRSYVAVHALPVVLALEPAGAALELLGAALGDRWGVRECVWHVCVWVEGGWGGVGVCVGASVCVRVCVCGGGAGVCVCLCGWVGGEREFVCVFVGGARERQGEARLKGCVLTCVPACRCSFGTFLDPTHTTCSPPHTPAPFSCMTGRLSRCPAPRGLRRWWRC